LAQAILAQVFLDEPRLLHISVVHAFSRRWCFAFVFRE